MLDRAKVRFLNVYRRFIVTRDARNGSVERRPMRRKSELKVHYSREQGRVEFGTEVRSESCEV